MLDTHVFLWFYQGARISKKVARRIEEAGAADELFVAAMTPWEIAMGARTGRIRVHGNVLDWIETALQKVAAGIAPIVPAIAVDAVELPGNWEHGDPIDRLIVATARHLDAILITADAKILDYAAKVKAIRVLEPS
ncbi:MAG TPA: type II toxin-antitoxin system VapC family toxin [Polyangiaceae bacterium]